MILTDGAIRQALQDGRLILDPIPPPHHFNTTAVDLRLGPILKVWEKIPKGANLVLDYDDVKIPDLHQFSQDATLGQDGSFQLEPNQFVLAQTLEKVGLPIAGKLAARVEGRSSLARLGVVVHLTAPTIHADFGGVKGAPITLEIINLGPFHIRIKPGSSRICQLIIEQVEGESGSALPSQFQNQKTPLG